MFKTLLKKQMMEVNTWLIQDRRHGKARSKSSMLGMLVLYVFLFASIGFIFYALGQSLCASLVAMDLGWLYFAMMSLISVVLGVFGSVFNTYSTLYMAKDNEQLLAMPIPPAYILAARILGVYLWSFIYTALAFVPAVIVYLTEGTFSVAALICSGVILIVLSVFVLMLSCILGYGVAKIAAKVKGKSFITVILSLMFIGVYYFVYFKAMKYISEFLANALTIGAEIKGKLLPIYWLGSAATGHFFNCLLVALIVAALMALTIWVMSRSFIKMATTSRGEKKKVYQRRKTAQRSVDAALLYKELRRYASSATYMMNCSLGTLFIPIVGVAALIKADAISVMIASMGLSADVITLIICAGLCSMASLNDVTAPSVSLEGKHLWIAQSLPVAPWRILKAKLKLHLLLTEIPLVFSAVCICAAVGLRTRDVLLCTGLSALFAILMGAFGLLLNLKLPNLTWTNEIVPIKQSASVTVALFGGWGIVMVFVGLYFLIGKWMTATSFLGLCILVVAAACTGMLVWLKNKGSRIYSTL